MKPKGNPNKFSPRQRKLMLKKDLLNPVKPLPIDSHYKEPIGKLDKKPTKKLIIKSNEKKSEEGSGKKMERQIHHNIQDKVT
jgi:hypothetical protein